MTATISGLTNTPDTAFLTIGDILRDRITFELSLEPVPLFRLETALQLLHNLPIKPEHTVEGSINTAESWELEL